MGIYNTNSYNPLGSIQAALNNVNEHNRIKNEYWKNKGQIWSNFAQNMGNIGNRMLDGIVAYSEGYDANDPEVRLAALEKELKDAQEAERIQAIQGKYNEQVAQRQAMDDYLKNAYADKLHDAAMNLNMDKGPSLSEVYSESMRGYKPNFAGYNKSEQWDGYNGIDIEDNLYRKILKGGVYA